MSPPAPRPTPEFNFSAWFGMLAPAHTPKPIPEQLHAAILKQMATPEMKKQLEIQGLVASGLGPDEFASLVKNAMPQWKETIESTGTKAR